MLVGEAKIDFDYYLSSDSLCYLMGINKNSFYDFPYYMQYGMIEHFLFLAGIIIDRDAPNTRFNVWDYRNEEPDEPIVIDYTYSESMEDAIDDLLIEVNIIYNGKR